MLRDYRADAPTDRDVNIRSLVRKLFAAEKREPWLLDRARAGAQSRQRAQREAGVPRDTQGKAALDYAGRRHSRYSS